MNNEPPTTVCRDSVDSCDEIEFCGGGATSSASAGGGPGGPGVCTADVLTSDINQTGRTDGFDAAIIGRACGSTMGQDAFNADADLSGMKGIPDGIIDGLDLDKFRQFFGCEANTR